MSGERTRKTATECDCCEGTDERTPIRIFNRSGLDTIAYRSGTHGEFFESMLAQLSSREYPALQGLQTRSTDDFSIALLDAFAASADVLTFYQERLANESYLRTATERQSIGELAKLLGYQLSRGVSASTDVVFTVDEPPVLPPSAPAPPATPDQQPVVIETGTKIQSVPGADEKPQLFETSEPIEGLPEWNEMRPLRLVDQDLAVGDRAILVNGLGTGVEVGDPLVVHEGLAHAIAWVSRVEEDPDFQTTSLRLQGPLARAFDYADGYRIVAASDAASIFGHNAVVWSALSTAAKADYLGVTEAEYLPLVVDDPSVDEEWQGFTIFSPDQPLMHQPPPDVLEASLETVLAKVVETTDQLATSADAAAQQAVPGTAIDATRIAGDVISATTQALTNTDFGATLATDTTTIKNAVTGLLQNLIKAQDVDALNLSTPDVSNIAQAITDLVDHDSSITTRLETVITSLNSIVDTSQLTSDASDLATAVSPVNLISQLLSEVGTAMAPVGQGATELVDSLEHLRQSLSNAAVTAGMSGFVRSIAENAVNAGLVTTATELDQLVRYTTGVADAAVRYAPGTNLVTQFNNFMQSLESAASPGDLGKLKFDEVADVGQDAALVGVAAAGAAGVIAIHPLLTPLLVVNMAMAGAAESSATAFSTSMNSAMDLVMQPVDVEQPVYRAGTTALLGHIDLDRVYPKVKPGDWVVLSRPGVQRAFRVVIARRASRAEFMISTTVTRLSLDGNDLGLFADGVRDTSVWLANQPLDPARVIEESSVLGRHIRLDRIVPAPVPGRKILVAGFDAADGSALSETAIVKTSREVEDARRVDDPRVTEIEIAHPLKGAYRRVDLRLFGNVAGAIHGETTIEILGNGDATVPFQSFVLKQAPLTYVSSDAPSGSESSLSIFVNDIEWMEVPFFYGHTAEERIFTTRKNASGELVARFGDGINGARLPTGTNNVRARYRKGTGLNGMVRKAQLSQLMTRPLGLQDAINPMAASGAANPEATEDARRNAPLTVLTMDRAVSLRDYEDYANAFSGIAKAHAAWFWDGRQRIILVTVAGPGGANLDPGGTTISNLRDSLRRFGDPHVQFHVLNYDEALFRFGARIVIEPGHVEDVVFRSLEQRIRGRFAFEVQQFAQPVVLSEVMQVAQTCPGVAAVDIDLLYRDDAPAPTLDKRLIADQATLNPDGTASAAELLTIHPDPFDKLEAVT